MSPPEPTATLSSQQVSWSEVHLFIENLLAQANVGPLPLAGTPHWAQLNDPLKLLALAVAGQHHVLRMETAQTAVAEASQAISAGADWGAVARGNLRHANAAACGAYIPRKTA